MCFNQRGDISTLNSSSLKLVDKFTHLGSGVSSTKTDIPMRLAKAWTAINRLSVIWKSDLTDEMKRSFLPSNGRIDTAVWTLTKCMEKKLHGSYTSMLQSILNKSWRQHFTKQQLYGHLPPIMKTIQIRRTRHVEYCWRSKDELISDILLWTSSHGQTKAGWPARTYIQHLCADIGCSLEDLPEVMEDREGWREIHRGGATWCWWLMLYWIVWNRTVFTFNCV